MTDGVTIAIITGAQLLLLTTVQGILTARKDRRYALLRRQDKADNYARQDAVAERLALTNKLVVESSIITQRQSSQLATLDATSRKIHILVNSDMTAARTNERDQTRLTLIALKRVQSLSVTQGLTIPQDELDAISTAEQRILELDAILADRHQAQLTVELEAVAAMESARMESARREHP
jgi:hypothetical protein